MKIAIGSIAALLLAVISWIFLIPESETETTVLPIGHKLTIKGIELKIPVVLDNDTKQMLVAHRANGEYMIMPKTGIATFGPFTGVTPWVYENKQQIYSQRKTAEENGITLCVDLAYKEGKQYKRDGGPCLAKIHLINRTNTGIHIISAKDDFFEAFK